MSTTRIRRFSSGVLSAVTAIAFFVFFMPIAGHAADKPPYLTATAAEVQAQIGLSRKLGEMDGDFYYFKPAGAGTGTGQIFRVSSKDPTKFAFVGTIISNQYMISTAEKSNFFAVVTDTPPSALTGDTSVVPLGSARPASVTPTPTPPTGAANAGNGPAVGKASWGDGHIPVVHFNQDPHFHDDVVAWRDISR
jgi:hypothetical protein